MAAAPPTRIVGSYLSPYVRKVLVCLHLKGVPYRIDPIVPFYGNDEFERLSPLRRIPLLIDDEVTVADSTVICEYLDERYPEPRLFPHGAVQRARARWLEEYADTRIGEVFIWRLFNQLALRRAVWGEAPDAEVLRRTREEDIPQVLDHLEGLLPPDGFLFGGVCVADIAIASFFRNASFVRQTVDASRWPLTAAFVERVLALPAFEMLMPYEQALLRAPIAAHRRVLAEAGAPLCADTLGAAAPRRGPMSV